MKVLTKAACALALTLVLGACASSGDKSEATTAGEAASNSQVAVNENSSKERLDPDAMRCKTDIKTGTRISRKICKTNREWEQEALDSRSATEAIQRGSLNGPGPEGG
ncbi:MAG: hypothetical protein ABJL54_01700 [Halioglobus sp.]